KHSTCAIIIKTPAKGGGADEARDILRAARDSPPSVQICSAYGSGSRDIHDSHYDAALPQRRVAGFGPAGQREQLPFLYQESHRRNQALHIPSTLGAGFI